LHKQQQHHHNQHHSSEATTSSWDELHLDARHYRSMAQLS
jgi:hypothetical protein